MIFKLILFFNIQPTLITFTSFELIIAKREIDDVVVQKLKGRRKKKRFYICVPGNFIQNMLNFTIGIEERKEL